MNKSAKSKDRRKAARGQLWLHLPGMVREALYDTVIGAGLACVEEVLETERVALCGERYEHLADRQALRAGHVASSLVLGGRRVAVQRPRASAVWRGASLGCRAGGDGAHAIRWSSAPWSRWCWECRPEATHARWSHCRKRSRYGASAKARSASGSSMAPSANWQN